MHILLVDIRAGKIAIAYTIVAAVAKGSGDKKTTRSKQSDNILHSRCPNCSIYRDGICTVARNNDRILHPMLGERLKVRDWLWSGCIYQLILLNSFAGLLLAVGNLFGYWIFNSFTLQDVACKSAPIMSSGRCSTQSSTFCKFALK